MHCWGTQSWAPCCEVDAFAGARHEDAIAVCAWSNRPNFFAIAYRREDQRPVKLPEGFKGRYALSVVKKGGHRINETDILAAVLHLGDEHATNLLLAQPKETPTAMEILSNFKSMSKEDLARFPMAPDECGKAAAAAEWPW